LHDYVIDDVVGLVDVMERTIAQTAGIRIIFLTGDIVVRLVQKFQRAMETARSIHAGIDGRMVVEIFAIINRGPFDLIDCSVDFANGALFFVVDRVGWHEPVEISARVTQVGERVQVGGMPSGFVGPGQSGAQGNQKHQHSTMS
jgi:hypothetical protein